MLMRLPIFFCFLVSISFCVNGQPDLKKLDAYYTKALKDWDIPGMSIAVVKDGKVVFSRGYGVKEQGRNERPDAHTLYAIASNTKAFTSAAIATLVDEGRLSWDDKVASYLPYFGLYDPWVSANTTIRDLLSHRVGLKTFSGDILWYRSTLTAEQILQRVKHLPKAFDFRSGYGYSNVMYLAAGEVIEKVSGESWHNYIRKRFLEPLGMSRSVTSVKDLQKLDNVATPHKIVDNKHIAMPWEEWATVAAMGGIISSVDDMAKWMIMNLNHGIYKHDTLFSAHSRNVLWTPHNIFPVDHTDVDNATHIRGYALGWTISDYHGHLRVGHTGGYSGMLSAVTLIPDEKLGVVILTNGLKGIYGPLVNYTIDAFLGLPSKDWSQEALKRASTVQDKRIQERREARIPGTKATLPLDQYAGTYHTTAYGRIVVTSTDGRLHLNFEHTPDLSASLDHWHHDVWEIKWDKPELLAWFSFGTVQFDLDNNARVTGIRFDVPNDDLWFEELNAQKIDPVVRNSDD
jgi:CubicO group peptidase (beta-lactamase class C family)